MTIRLLVVEGNTREGRAAHEATFGLTPSASYATVLCDLAPDSTCDVVCPADADAALPSAVSLGDYDGVVLTGSALHLWQRDAAVTRQIELMRAVYASRVPAFGSCWGIQMGAVAAGGDVQPNPNGREIGFARNIAVLPAGEDHPLLAGRPRAFTAPAIHLDAITTLPPDCTVLASNALTPVQAAEIRHDGGTFWGVQYHPEFSIPELTAILGRITGLMVAEGFVTDEPAARAYIADLAAAPGRPDAAWRHGLDAQVLDDGLRLTEIRNFIDMRVRPRRAARTG